MSRLFAHISEICIDIHNEDASAHWPYHGYKKQRRRHQALRDAFCDGYWRARHQDLSYGVPSQGDLSFDLPFWLRGQHAAEYTRRWFRGVDTGLSERNTP